MPLPGSLKYPYNVAGNVKTGCEKPNSRSPVVVDEYMYLQV